MVFYVLGKIGREGGEEMNLDLFGTKGIEEIKPGVFVRQDPKGRYRAVDPIFWKGKFKLGAFVRRWFMFAIIMFLVWAYVNDTEGLREFYYDFQENPAIFCADKITVNIFGDPSCTPQMEEFGLCGPNSPEINLSVLDVRSG